MKQVFILGWLMIDVFFCNPCDRAVVPADWLVAHG